MLVRPSQSDHLIVDRWMSTPVRTASSSDSLRDAVAMMEANRFNHLPVVDNGKVVGMVTMLEARVHLSHLDRGPGTPDFPLGEVMTKRVTVIRKGAPVMEVLAHMLRREMSAFPVVDGDTVVGIVTKTDILRCFGYLLNTTPERELAKKSRTTTSEIMRAVQTGSPGAGGGLK